MLTKKAIQEAFERLNTELATKNIKGEVCLYGGAVMCLVFDARPSTRDVDAVFQPSSEIRNIAAKIGPEMGLNESWLNDGVKGFLVEHTRRVLFEKPHLKVMVPEPDYLLAMKVLAARVDTNDAGDVKFLIHHLNLKKPEDVFKILEQYYPEGRIRPATRFFVEELFNL